MIIGIAGIIFALLIILCIIFELATSNDHEGAFFACGIAFLLGFVIFYGLI